MTDDNSQTVTAALIGAVLGAIAGFLFFTDRGRKLRQQVDHALDEVVRELDHTRDTLHEVAATVDEGGTLLDERRVEQESHRGRRARQLFERHLHDVGVIVLRGDGDIEMTAVK